MSNFVSVKYLANKERVCASDLEGIKGGVVVNVNLISSVSLDKMWDIGLRITYCELKMSNGNIFYLPPSEGSKLRTIIINL